MILFRSEIWPVVRFHSTHQRILPVRCSSMVAGTKTPTNFRIVCFTIHRIEMVSDLYPLMFLSSSSGIRLAACMLCQFRERHSLDGLFGLIFSAFGKLAFSAVIF